MAKELMFKLGGTDYGAAPVKLERKKIYGWTDIVATDPRSESGLWCNSQRTCLSARWHREGSAP